MSKTDYIHLSSAIYNVVKSTQNADAVNEVIDSICEKFSRSEPRFNADKFRAACGVE